MKILDLFSGIGGISLGLERAGMQTVAFCEIEPFQRAVLKKHWPEVPVYEDIRNISADILRCAGIDGVDIIAGGFPCQDVSVAGKGAGVEHGERSGLWREMFRLVRELMPRWVLAENVPALRTRGGDLVIADLESAGYAVWPLVVGAWAVGAPHKRDRIWIVAHRDERRSEIERGPQRCGNRTHARWNQPDGCGEPMADANENRPEARHTPAEPDEQMLGSRCRHASGLPRTMGDPDEGERERRAEPLFPPSKGRQTRYQHSGAGASQWPARPGELQHEWEESRIMRPVGASTDGVPEQLVRFANRCTLGAAGNSVVPQVVEVIGRAIMVMEVAA